MIKKVSNFIAPEIYQHISVNTRIFSIISQCLPDNVASHTECIGSDGKTLRIAADSAALASQLRFYADAMLTALHKENFSQFKRIKVVTREVAKPVLAAKSRSDSTKTPQLSAQTSQMIRSTANSIGDERLRRAMAKLADFGENQGD